MKLTTIILLLAVMPKINAQILSSRFFSNPPRQTNSLFFTYLPYLKNNEYFATNIKGYTITGQQMQLGYHWQPNTKLSFNFGMAYNQFFGYNKPQIYPILSMKLKLNQIQLTTGNLPATSFVNMLNQMYSYENFMLSPQNYGFQLKINTNRQKLQTSLSWQKFIFYKSYFPEKIYFASNYNFIIDSTNTQKTTFNIQIFITHNGGQIDSSNWPTVTTINFASGTKSTFLVTKNLKTSIANYLLLFYLPTQNHEYPFTSGSAYLLDIQVQYKKLTVSQQFWLAKDYFNPVGDMYFNNYNPFNHSSTDIKLILPTSIDFTSQIFPDFYIKLGLFTYLANLSKLDYGYYFLIRYNFSKTLRHKT